MIRHRDKSVSYTHLKKEYQDDSVMGQLKDKEEQSEEAETEEVETKEGE